MTLTIAVNLTDFIILTGDQRLTLELLDSNEDNQFKMTIDQYKKIRKWRYGAIVTSGAVILMDLFYKHLQFESGLLNSELDLFKVASKAVNDFLTFGYSIVHAVGWAYFSFFTDGELTLIGISIDGINTECDYIQPLHANFSMYAGTPNSTIFQDFVNQLREVNHFNTTNDFINYHLNLISRFYLNQKRIDDSITSSFDYVIQDTITGNMIEGTVLNNDALYLEN